MYINISDHLSTPKGFIPDVDSLLVKDSHLGWSLVKCGIRDDVCWDQQGDVVIVFWACCILPIWGYSPRICHATPAPQGSCTLYSTLNTTRNSGALASNWQNTLGPKYNINVSLLNLQYLISVWDWPSHWPRNLLGIDQVSIYFINKFGEPLL